MSIKKEIDQLLQQYNFKPLKSLSQNFLIDEHIFTKILSAGELDATDTVIEIGPGLGTLTQRLAPLVNSVMAFEIDKGFIQILQDKFKNNSNITIIHKDILEAQDLVQQIQPPYKVIANIPYHITARIIRLFLTSANQPQSITLLVQKEIGDKLTSHKDNKTSLFKLSVDMYARTKVITKVSLGCFYPSPKVDSAVISIIPHHNYPDLPIEEVLHLASTCFQQKRKQLRKVIFRHYDLEEPVVSNVLKDLKIQNDIRPEDMTTEQWIRLYKAINTVVDRKID